MKGDYGSFTICLQLFERVGGGFERGGGGVNGFSLRCAGWHWRLGLSLNPSIGSLKKQRRHYLLNGWSNGVNNFQAAYRRRIRQPEKVEWGLNGNRASVCANRF